MTKETEKPAQDRQDSARPRIEHVNLIVTAIDPTVHFLKAAFPHWDIRGEGGGAWAGVPRRWVHMGDDDNYITLKPGARGEIIA